MHRATTGFLNKDRIRIHPAEDFAGMRAAGQLTAACLDMIAPYVQPGVKTSALDARIQAFIEDAGAESATIGYRGFQHASCISVNNVVCHGIPGAPIPKAGHETVSKDLEKRRDNDTLQDGDIVNIDVTCILNGWFGDSSRMYVAGKLGVRDARLIKVTYECLMLGIEAVKPGNTFGDIGAAIQHHAEANRMSVVRDFCGHGLGQVFHAEPNVVHYGRPGKGPKLEEGMFFTIEPMINLGKPFTKVLADGWTAVTKDKKNTAQFEHSIGVTADGFEIFTESPAGKFYPTWGG